MFEVTAMIHSLKNTDTAKVIEKTGDNEYIVEYNGKKCTAIFNFFTGLYYVDDVYGVIE